MLCKPHPTLLCCEELQWLSWDGEFSAHNRASQNLQGAEIPWACFGQKTAFIQEFFCEIHSLRLE